jgi:hypothetical protein
LILCFATPIIQLQGQSIPGLRRRTMQDVPVNGQPSQTEMAAQKAFELTASSVAATVLDNCETPRDTSSALHFFAPLSVGDDLGDAWCKFQSFASTEKIKVYLASPQFPGELMPIVQSSFTPDGTVHLSKRQFVYNVVLNLLSNSRNPFFQRTTHNLAFYGIPQNQPEALYTFNAANIVVELQGVEVAGIKFTARETFSPEVGLIVREHSNPKPSYLQFTIRDRTVAFPWVLYSLHLESTDPRVDIAGSEVRKSMIGKYQKWVKSEADHSKSTQMTMPRVFTPNPRSVELGGHETNIADGSVTIYIAEGMELQTRKRYIDIQYAATNNGPLDRFTPGMAAFTQFVAAAKHKQSQGIVDAAKASPF